MIKVKNGKLMSKFLLVFLIGFMFFALIPFVSAVSCGDTITSNTVLTSDLLNCPENGLNIGANNVMLDCAGYKITGDMTAYEADYGTGIKNLGFNNITIKNCVLSKFSVLIYFKGNNSILQNNTFKDTTPPDAPSGTRGSNLIGIQLESANFNEIISNNLTNLVGGKGNKDLDSAGSVTAITLSSSSNNNIISNILSSLTGGPGNWERLQRHGGSVSGISLSAGSSNNSISSNTISSLTGGWGSGYAYGGDASAIGLSSSSGNKIISNNITSISGGNSDRDKYGGSVTVMVISSSNNTIKYNTISSVVGGNAGPCYSESSCRGGGVTGLSVGASNNIIESNTISSLTGGSGPLGGGAVTGMSFGGLNHTIKSNLIYSLSGGNSGAATSTILALGGAVNNTFIQNNFTGAQVGISLASTSINNTISQNNVYNNSLYNLKNDQSFNISVSGNWWGTTDCIELNAKIYDFADDSSKGIANYEPFLTSPYPGGTANGAGCIISTSVQLISPPEKSTDLDGNIAFNCSISDFLTDLSNVTLFVWNTTGVYYTNTIPVSGRSATGSWNINLPQGTYKWNCLAYNNVSSKNWGNVNRTVYSITGCGATLISDMTLTADLLNCSGNGINIGVDNMILDCAGHTVSGSSTGTGNGISISGKNNVTVRNCKVTGFKAGLYSGAANNSKIINNDIFNNDGYDIAPKTWTRSQYYGYGILLQSSFDNNISNNNVSNNKGDNGYGIVLQSSSNNVLSNNNVSNNNGYVGYGYGISLQSSTNNFVLNNYFMNNYGRGAIWGSGGVGIELVSNSINNTISSNNIRYNYGDSALVNDGLGVIISSSSYNSFSNNNITDNSAAGGVTATNRGYGIKISSSSNNNTFLNNNVSNNHAQGGVSGGGGTNYVYGIYLISSFNNNFLDTVISGNKGIGVNNNAGYGIYFSSSSNNSITESTIDNNQNNGVYVDNSSNTIFKNNIYNNTVKQIYFSTCPSGDLATLFGGGNWWGRTSEPYFVSVTDTNCAGLTDSMAYNASNAWVIPAVCGNNLKEGSEACDGTDTPTCEELYPGWTGTVTCNPGCMSYADYCLMPPSLICYGTDADNDLCTNDTRDLENDCCGADGHQTCIGIDNCPDEYNPDHSNADGDSYGDVCDPCPSLPLDNCNSAYSGGENYNPANSLNLSNPANTVSLTIPANAAGQDVSVSFTKITTGKDFEICTKTTSGATSCFYPINSEIYSFEPEITFIQPIDLRFYYGSNPNCPIGKCDIFWYNETSAKWTQQRANCTAVPGWCVLNTSFGNAINHFSEYALAFIEENIVGSMDIYAGTGDSIPVNSIVSMNQTTGGFEFELNLSEELNCNDYEVNPLISDAYVAFNNKTKGMLKISVLADINQPIPLNIGNAVELKCKVAADAEDGIYLINISDIVVADEKGKIIQTKEADSNLYIDTIPPAVTVSGIPTQWRKYSAFIYLLCDDATTNCVSLKYGLSATQSCTATNDYLGSIIVSSESYVCYGAKDSLGNTASGIVHVDYFDFNAPETTAAFNVQSKLAVLTATDDLSGVNKTGYCVDLDNSCASFEKYAGAINISSTAIGQSETGKGYLRYYSYDNAMNIEAVKSLEIQLDRTPPIIEFVKNGVLGNNNWYVSAVNLTIRAYDALSGVLNLNHSVE